MLSVGKSLWGVEEAGDPSKWDTMLERIAAEGFSLVETICIFDMNQDPALFRNLLDKHGLGLIVQVHTGSDWANFNYCNTCDVGKHVASFRALVSSALQHSPTVINVHSGHDSWDTSTAVDYFQQVLAIEQELLVGLHADVTLVHETHRQRLLFSPYQTRDVLACPSLAALKINCDLSHWVVGCERVFDETEAGGGRDGWWPAVLAMAARHCHLVHARVGHAEGPQVVDPRSSPAELAAHLKWWQAIWAVQGRTGVRSIAITEHGPEPYQMYDTPQLPGAEVGSGKSALSDTAKSAALWHINSFVKDQLLEVFPSNPSYSSVV